MMEGQRASRHYFFCARRWTRDDGETARLSSNPQSEIRRSAIAKMLRAGGDLIINRFGATKRRVSALKPLDLPYAVG